MLLNTHPFVVQLPTSLLLWQVESVTSLLTDPKQNLLKTLLKASNSHSQNQWNSLKKLNNKTQKMIIFSNPSYWGVFFDVVLGFPFGFPLPTPLSLFKYLRKKDQKKIKHQASFFSMDFTILLESLILLMATCENILSNIFHWLWWGQLFCVFFWYYQQQNKSPVCKYS